MKVYLMYTKTFKVINTFRTATCGRGMEERTTMGGREIKKFFAISFAINIEICRLQTAHTATLKNTQLLAQLC